jgi:Gpi18-like mannosyltransferase
MSISALSTLLVRRKLSGTARVWFVMAFLLTLAVRLYYCAQAPIDTSDLYRHLGFTSHFLENPASFYKLLPSQFPHEFWSQFWTEISYIYPPLALLFFAAFGTLGAGLFWVKLTLTLFDLGSAFLIARATSWWAGLLVFSAPVTIWYTSHEGQYESLVTFLVVFTILSARSGRWFWTGVAFMLALQTKQLALLIAPYLLYEIFLRRHLEPRKAVVGFLIGFFGAFLPFAPFYWWRHDLWLLPLQNQENLLNPFYWPLFWRQGAMAHFEDVSHLRIVWNEVVTTIPLALLIVFVTRGSWLRRIPQALPSITFWVMIKSMAWVMNWYVILIPGLTVALWRHRRWLIVLLAFYWLQCGQQVSSYLGDDDYEEGGTVTRFKECIWHCNYRAVESTDWSKKE